MLKALKFVQGAVSKKDFIPALTHFRIQDGFVTGCNGWLTLRAPINLDIVAAPKANLFVKAVESCEGTASLHKTPAGKLAVCSASFKSFVDCLDNDVFPSMPTLEGELYPVSGDFIGMVRTLAPFVCDTENAQGEWVNSLFMRADGNNFATDNIKLIQMYTGAMLPLSTNLCIPYHTIRELLRIGQNPIAMGWDSKGILFMYENNMWMHTTQRQIQWNDSVESMFPPYGPVAPVPEGLFPALKKIKPFVDEAQKIYFKDGVLRTSETEGEGTTITFDGCPKLAGFTLRHLLALEGVATHIDFDAFPNPSVFYGNGLRGLVVGLNKKA